MVGLISSPSIELLNSLNLFDIGGKFILNSEGVNTFTVTGRDTELALLFSVDVSVRSFFVDFRLPKVVR